MISSSALLSSLLIKRLDNLGLVAGLCQEMKLVEAIDAIIPKHQDCCVTHGQAVLAMILNGLGFHSRALYLCPEFFEQKPTERLIGKGITPEHLNDDVLGRALDALFNKGVSEIYQHLAEKLIDHLGIKSDAIHLDITSFHVDGKYELGDGEDTGRISLTKGYSRDHRPDLNQVVLELICENQAGIPVFMRALDGNTNDTSAFADVAKHHIRCLKAAQQSRYFVGDAALYTQESLRALDNQKQKFVTRVPATLSDAKRCISALEHHELITFSEGYSGYWQENDYASVKQKWLVIRSEQAQHRELETLNKRIDKQQDKEAQSFNKLCKQPFACQKDATIALESFEKTLKFSQINKPDCQSKPVYASKGRPKKHAEPAGYEYFLAGEIMADEQKIAQQKTRAGVFILATNDLSATLSMESLLKIYKSQQSVERGFRFLKSPEFFMSSMYLKKPERIEALLMVMTCSLMIYAALQHKIRENLKMKQQYFPDSKKKPTQKPTARWVFYCFCDINVLELDAVTSVQHLDKRQKIIINILGERYRQIYS